MVNEETIGRRETKLGILRKDYPDEIDDLITDPAHPKYPIAKIMMFGLGKDDGGASTYLNNSGISFETKIGGSLAERMRIHGSGYVGIGTENPPAMLSVKGIEQFEISNAPGVSTTINSQDVHSLSWNDLSKVSVGDTIKIGSDLRIVTEKHDPDHSNLIQGYLTVDSNFSTSNSAASMTVLPNIFRADDEFGFAKLIISNDGLVGIGTEKPSAMLTIQQKNNTITFNVAIGYGSYNTINGTYCINIDNDPRFSKIKVGDEVIINGTKILVKEVYVNYIKLDNFMGSNFNQYDTTMIFTENSGGINTPFFRIKDSQDIVKFSIESDGKVGIGTTTPIGKLQIDEGDDWINGIAIRLNHLGISTGPKIEFNKNFSFWYLPPPPPQPLKYAWSVGIRNGINVFDFAISEDGSYNNVGIPRITIRKGGDVVVSGKLGTSGYDPGSGYPPGWDGGIHTKDVYAEGTIGAGQGSNLKAYLDSDGNGFFSGNVGIGIDNPSEKLEVVGNVSIKGGTLFIEDYLEVGLDVDAKSNVRIRGRLDVDNILKVNGDFGTNGNVSIHGNLGTHGLSPDPDPMHSGWGGGIHTWDVEAEGTIWSAHGLQVGNGNEIFFEDNGQIRSSSDDHRIRFRRSEDILEFIEYGSIYFTQYNNSYNLWVRPLVIDATGYVVTDHPVVLGSDGRLKKNIKPLKNSLNQLLKLRGVTYEWKEPEKIGHTPGEKIGMIAQEVEEVFPDWVRTIPDEMYPEIKVKGGIKGLSISGFEALVVEALKELNAQNEELAAKNIKLELRIRILEKKNKT